MTTPASFVILLRLSWDVVAMVTDYESLLLCVVLVLYTAHCL